jgi:hypothetical protein
MSRDHYKGIPKTRDAVIRPDGSIAPLSKEKEPAHIRTDGVYTNMSEEPKARIRIYARATGHDTNGDGTLENPYRTFYRCMQDLPMNADGRVFYIDISGIGTEVRDQVTVSFPPLVGGGGLYNTVTHPLQEFEDAGNNYFREGVVNIVASPTVLHSFTPTSQTSDSHTNNKNLVSTGAGWAPDEFKGKFVTNYTDGMYVIFGNTEDTLSIGRSSTLSGEIHIVEPSAVLKYGSASRPDYSTFTPHFDFSPLQASLAIWGVGFESPTNTVAVDISVTNMVQITGCTFDGIYVRGYNFLEMNGVYTSPGTFVIVGGTTMYCRYSLIDKPGYFDLGSAGADAHVIYNSMVDGADQFPHYLSEGTGYAYQPGSLTMVSTTVVSGTTNGIQVAHGSPVTLDRVSIKDCPGDAIKVSEGGHLTVRRTYGSGSTGYGINVQNGAQVLLRDTATNVTGDMGDFKVGVLSSDTWANFNSGFRALADVTAVSGTMSRMFNPASY